MAEVDAGTMLNEEDVKDVERLRAAVPCTLADDSIAAGAARMSDDLRSCAGPSGAADFIEQIAAS